MPPHDPVSPSKCSHHADSQVTGVSVQVTKTGHKSFWFATTVAGRKRHAKIGTHPAITIEEARTRALAMRAAIERGENPFEEQHRLKTMPLFKDFVALDYMPFAQQHKRSVDDDESKFRLHLNPAFGERRMCDISLQDIQRYLTSLLKTLSKATGNRHLALLSRLFGLAVQWGRMTKNPCTGIAKFKEGGGMQRFLTSDEASRVMEAAKQDQNAVAGAAIMMLLLTGCRREGIPQARYENLDLDQGLLLLPTTKPGKPRYVILNDAARALLSGMSRVDDSPWIFPGRFLGTPLNNPRKAFLRILEAAGVDACRIHDLRHTFASLLVAQGASLFQVQQLLGHESQASTRTYAHLTSSALRGAAQGVGRAVGSS